MTFLDRLQKNQPADVFLYTSSHHHISHKDTTIRN